MKIKYLKIVGGVLLLLLMMTACSRASFETKTKTADADLDADVAEDQSADATAGEGGADSGDLGEAEERASIEECALAADADKTDVISISHGDLDTSAIAPGSVLRLRVQGLAVIDLTATELPELKGICLDARGNASAKVLIDAPLPSLFYLGRGNADVTVEFAEGGTLDKLGLDVSGSSSLSLSGSKLDCAALEIEQAGASQVQCSGT
jgi:hypothetical protein